jgi:histidinol dehydrogenase
MKKIDCRQRRDGLDAFLAARKASRTQVRASVHSIRDRVLADGWEAIADYTGRFDGIRKEAKAEAFQVREEDLKRAAGSLPPELESAVEFAIDRVRTFHSKQKRSDWFHEETGIRTGQMFRPLERIGVYAPAGTAPLFSTLIMDAVPGQVAGCPSILVCSAPQKETGTVHALILATCAKLGIPAENIWAMGSAWGIFALAYGLPGLERVDGIFGPGNMYVMEAKRIVQGEVRIESLPGNSEILVIADDSADPAFVAADLLSQAEHAGGEMSILVTDSEALLDAVCREVSHQLGRMTRRDIAASSLETGGAAVLVNDLEQACEIANLVAPEHLEIQTVEPENWLALIRNAGAVFVGEWATEPIGDYTAGTNHVLPTGGTARFSSALSVDDYMKKISIVQLTAEGVAKVGPPATVLAESEGLLGHKNAIDLRLAKLKTK